MRSILPAVLTEPRNAVINSIANAVAGSRRLEITPDALDAIAAQALAVGTSAHCAPRGGSALLDVM